MVSRIGAYIRKYQMIREGEHIAAGISGGADSVCLLFVLAALREELSFQLTAVHVEHGLRGEESLKDAAFTEQLCRQLHVPFRLCRVDMQARARETGMSLEEAGRELRYACFRQVCREEGASAAAVAHHQNDQAETVLQHLFRGSGLRGLCGMRPVRLLRDPQGAEEPLRIIRPLLCVSRTEIENWLREQEISWRTDSTNLSEEFSRNKIRLRLLPYIEQEIQPGTAEHLAAAAERLQQVQDYLDRQTERAYAACAGKAKDKKSGEIRLKTEILTQQDPLLQVMILQRAMEELGAGLKDTGAVHWEKLCELAENGTGKCLQLPLGVQARREYGELVLEYRDRNTEKDGEFLSVAEIPGTFESADFIWHFSLEEAKKNQLILEKTYTKWFDYDRIIKCLDIRTRRPGDFLEINEAHGRKKLKDYFIDCKMPRQQREEQILLAEGSHVLWIVGKRISEAYKVTAQTRRLLKVEVDHKKKRENGAEKAVQTDFSVPEHRRK